MNNFQHRLSAFLQYKDLPMHSFEKQSKIGVGVGARLSDNSRKYTFDRISRAFPDLNINWLKTGEGEMLNPTNQSRNINKIGNDATFTMGDYSHVFKDDTIEIEDCGAEQPNKDIVKIRYTIRSYKKKIEELEKQVAHLEGQVAQQSEFIKLLMQNK